MLIGEAFFIIKFTVKVCLFQVCFLIKWSLDDVFGVKELPNSSLSLFQFLTNAS